MNSKPSLAETADRLLNSAFVLASRSRLSFVRWLIEHRISRDGLPFVEAPQSNNGSEAFQRRIDALQQTPNAIAIYERLNEAAALFNQAGAHQTEREVRDVMADIDRDYRVLHFQRVFAELAAETD